MSKINLMYLKFIFTPKEAVRNERFLKTETVRKQLFLTLLNFGIIMRDILSALWSVIGAKSSSCTGWMMPRVGLPNEISKTWPRIRQSLRQETDCRTCMKQAKICISLSLLYERNSKSIPLTSGIRCRILGKINPKLIGNVFWWVISKKCYKLADATLTRNWYKSDKETNFYCFKDCQCERKVTFSKQFFQHRCLIFLSGCCAGLASVPRLSVWLMMIATPAPI